MGLKGEDSLKTVTEDVNMPLSIMNRTAGQTKRKKRT